MLLDGPLVPVMPAFDDDDRLDLDATARLIDALIGSGIGAFWTTYGTSHFFSLTDREIRDLTASVAAVTRGRARFIASTSYHWPLEDVLDFCRAAADLGVDAVKVQVDWRLAPAEAGVVNHYRRVAAGSPLPLFAYALGNGTFGASNAISGPRVAAFREILAIPEIVGMKNDAGDFYENSAYLAAVRGSGRSFDVVTGGSMESFLHGRQFGQRAYAVGLGMLAPGVALAFHRLAATDATDEAAALVRDVEQPAWSALASVGFWPALHEALRLQGRFPSAAVRFPQRPLDDDGREVVRSALKALEEAEGQPR